MKTVLGSPTTLLIPARGEKTLRYGVLFAPYEGDALDNGIAAVEAEAETLTATGREGQSRRFKADPGFALLKKISASL
jgi:hypothetical protein